MPNQRPSICSDEIATLPHLQPSSVGALGVARLFEKLLRLAVKRRPQDTEPYMWTIGPIDLYKALHDQGIAEGVELLRVSGHLGDGEWEGVLRFTMGADGQLWGGMGRTTRQEAEIATTGGDAHNKERTYQWNKVNIDDFQGRSHFYSSIVDMVKEEKSRIGQAAINAHTGPAAGCATARRL